ncbi:hypothetical protein [Streptomyces sp. NPDC000851]
MDKLHLDGGAFSSGFSTKCRMLDKAPYWVDFPLHTGLGCQADALDIPHAGG